METILLASSSERRIELLESLGIAFLRYAPDIDESLFDTLAPDDRVLALAEAKARAAMSAYPSPPRLILAADTLVCVTRDSVEIALGKPQDEEDARRMIGLLAGRTHVVRTGIALLDRVSGTMRVARSDSAITFGSMNGAEIDTYIKTAEWIGVAGAYRIQGLAACFIDRLEGSWSGVVGLPMRELYGILDAADYRFPLRG